MSAAGPGSKLGTCDGLCMFQWNPSPAPGSWTLISNMCAPSDGSTTCDCKLVTPTDPPPVPGDQGAELDANVIQLVLCPNSGFPAAPATKRNGKRQLRVLHDTSKVGVFPEKK
jgi:hypothetical protein